MLFDRYCRNTAPHTPRGWLPPSLRTAGLTLLMLPLVGQMLPKADAAAGRPEPRVALGRPAAVPQALREAAPLGHLPQETVVKVALSLPWRNPGQLDTLIHQLGDPHDPLYKKYLTHRQFVARFAPTQADYDTLSAWATANSLSVVETTPSRKLLVVSGRRDAVESAFHVRMNDYRLATGRVVYAATSLPSVPQSIAAHLSAVVGLTNFPQYRPHYVRKDPRGFGERPLIAGTPFQVGTGPGGGLTPPDIRSIYGLSAFDPSGLDGTGQTIALYEQNGYDATDITQYAKTYAIPDPVAANRLQNITIGAFNGVPTDPGTQAEVTLDIEMVLAVAPKANILVYELDSNTLDTTVTPLALLTKIADEDKAQIVSESYGTAEADASFGGELIPENDLFKQMAAQGQSMFASSGDSGAYNLVVNDATAPNTQLVSVNDPASQPLVTGVGGTSLKTAPFVGGIVTYGSETTWNTAGLPNPEGGGGGESKFWPKPDYQIGVGSSATMRDVPDVSLNADPNTGYSIFIASQGTLALGGVTGYDIVGGTSASSPLWAAFTALVNQQRQVFGLLPLGFANPDIYSVAEGADYDADFHDIADGSTNLVYSAVKGYDDATGWGSFIGTGLLPEFAPTTFGSGPITVTVVDKYGNPVSGATVTVKSAQIKNFQTQNTSAANGTTTFALPTGLHNFNNTGQDATLSYIVSADYPNLAGQAVANVVPPAAITLTVQAPDHTYPNASIQMISSPYDYSTVGDFATLFGLTPPLSNSGSTAQLYAYSPILTAYVTYPTAPADTLRRGQGYWALLPTNAYVRRIGVYPQTPTTFRINLFPGWNMIGDPFLQNVQVSGIQVDTVVPGTPVGIGSTATVQLPLYSYNGTAYQALGTGDSLQPYVGYWIHATQPAVLVIPAP